MSRIESRIKEMIERLTQWWNSNSSRAASRARDFRESERGQRAASKLNDLRTSDTAKRAEAAFNDLRASDAAKKAESALADLRQREPVKKAEEGARKVMHDIFSGGPGKSDTTGTAR
jgi:thioredoxin-like negative regulator of GroEL